MFQGDQWAAAFVNVQSKSAPDTLEGVETGLAFLKALIPPIKAIPGALFGRSDARRLEQFLRESAAGAGFGGTNAAEYAIRFICLLVENNNFRYIDSLVARIEQRLNEQKGILDVTVESVSVLDRAFEESLRRAILERSGAAGINMRACIVPELLAGYRLRMGGFFVDASLRGQLEKMTADLGAL